MRSKFLDFTRGSQVAETVGMMFATSLRPMLLTTTAIIAGTIGYQLWRHTNDGDSYYWIMRGYASAWHYFGFDPTHIVGLKTQTEGTVRVHIDSINSYPPLKAAWDRLTSAIATGGLYGLAIGIPFALLTTAALKRFGHSLTERKHSRGARLATRKDLLNDVMLYNTKESGPERHQIAVDLYGKWKANIAFTPAQVRAVDARMHTPYTIGGIPYPWRAEQSHTMLVGTTGTGKSTVIKDILAQIKARGGRAVVFDLTGTFVEGFYNPDTDIILNPFDARCPKWSPFSDARTREHFKEVSQALVPMGDGGGEQFWPETARMLFVETCVRLVEQGRGNNQALSDVLMTSKLKDLHAHVIRTIAAPLTDPEAKRMAESIRATFNTYAQALMTLPNEGPEFSIRDWILGIDGDTIDELDDVIVAKAKPAEKPPIATSETAQEGVAKTYTYDTQTGEILSEKPELPKVQGSFVYEHTTGRANEAPAAGRTQEAASKPDAPVGERVYGTSDGSVLFIAAQHVNLRSVRVLLTMWVTTAINTLMSMRGDQRDIRLWFLLDEIGALHNIPAIVSGMQTSRNYGGAFVLGVHTMAQLKETYGDNNAETISSLAKTKLLLNTRDRGTQDWESQQVGEGEWNEMEENWSYGVDNVRDAATLQKKIKLEPLVLPSEFGELPDLQGYLKFPQGLPAARIALTYVKYKRQAKGYIERDIPPLYMPWVGEDEAAAPSPVPPAKLPAPPPAPPPASDPGEGFQVAKAPTKKVTRVPAETIIPNDRAVGERRERDAAIASTTSLDPRWPNRQNGDGAAGAKVTPEATKSAGEDTEADQQRPAKPQTQEVAGTGLAMTELRANFQHRTHEHGFVLSVLSQPILLAAGAAHVIAAAKFSSLDKTPDEPVVEQARDGNDWAEIDR